MSSAFLLLLLIGQAGSTASPPPPPAATAPAAPAPAYSAPGATAPAAPAPAYSAPGATAPAPIGSAPAPTVPTAAAVPAFPQAGGGRPPTTNMVQWDSNSLPPVYERSEQGPIVDQELTKLTQAGFTTDQLVRMLAERRCACDASPDGLVRLRQAG